MEEEGQQKRYAISRNTASAGKNSKRGKKLWEGRALSFCGCNRCEMSKTICGGKKKPSWKEMQRQLKPGRYFSTIAKRKREVEGAIQDCDQAGPARHLCETRQLRIMRG